MTTIYRLGLDGTVIAQWTINKIIPNGDMSGDGRIDVSPDGKRLLLSIDMGEESGRKDWDGPLPALWSFDLDSQRSLRLTLGNFSGGTAAGLIMTTFSSSVSQLARKKPPFIGCRPTEKI